MVLPKQKESNTMKNKHDIKLTKVDDGWVFGKIGTNKFTAQVFDTGSQYGIDGGRVSRLFIEKNGSEFSNYERVWCIKPQTLAQKKLTDTLVAYLEDLPSSDERDRMAAGLTQATVIAQLEEIALAHCDVETLEKRWSDSLDFHDISVWGLRSALEAAYRLGQQSKK